VLTGTTTRLGGLKAVDFFRLFAALAELGARKALEARRLDRLVARAAVPECAGADAVQRGLNVVELALVNRSQAIRQKRLAAIPAVPDRGGRCATALG